MTVVTPKTHRREMPWLDSGEIPFEDIKKVAEELDCAFWRLEGLMRSKRGRRLMNGAQQWCCRSSLPDLHLLLGRGG